VYRTADIVERPNQPRYSLSEVERRDEYGARTIHIVKLIQKSPELESV
jgi:hypothetical protein